MLSRLAAVRTALSVGTLCSKMGVLLLKLASKRSARPLPFRSCAYGTASAKNDPNFVHPQAGKDMPQRAAAACRWAAKFMA